jgi:membrane-associated phospholipid phosphatase
MRLPPGRPLLAGSARPWAAAILVCCATLVGALAILFAHQATPSSLDRAVDSPVIAWLGGHQGLLLLLTAPGSLIPATVLCAATVIACLLSGRLNGAVLVAVALLAAVGMDDGLLKHLVHRTYLGQLTYPSGHTTAIFTLAAAVTVLLLSQPQPAKPGPLRAAIPAATCALGIVVAVGVIGLRWHYFTDTVAGAAVGIGTVCGLALVLDLPAARRWLARPSRQASTVAESS